MRRRLLLCSDLDGTLLPNGPAPESPRARPLFRRLIAGDGVTLVYVTGRDRDLVAAAVAQYALPQPSYLITDVGTTITGPDRRRWRAWDEHIAEGWGGRSHAEVVKLAGPWPDLRLQDAARQGRFKVSYEAPPASDPAVLAAAIAERLHGAGLQVAAVASRDEVSGWGLVDILPKAAGKAAAIEFLRERLGYTREQTVFAGDSGNDLDVLVGPLPAVLVANAAAEVREAARRGAAARGHDDRLYVAAGGVLGLNGNYAAGIIEGVLHFQPEWASLFEEGA